ncbi:MAG TPA: efflux RND transporter periplasmic adaptor subunit [Vicinamibacterales bacterium]|nr:efflux RND transporter periplasmic adaptor subunit [Vicinamibacterales bacterium]
MRFLAAAAVLVLASAAPSRAQADRPRDESILRIAGTVEAVKSVTIVTPRLTGPGSNSLVITKLVAAGSRVRAGDVLVRFDPQDQVRTAQDRRAEYLDFEEQIRKKASEQTAARAKDETELAQAEHDVERARLDVTKNDLLPRIEAEKNTLALEQAQARFAALGRTFDLKRRAAAAEMRMLEIRRDRARAAMAHAENNARRMTILAPFDGLAVVKQVWKGGTMGDVQEGEEVRAGVPILDVVDPNRMQVRARVNQADIAHVAVGRRARVRLDAYPELVFDGRIEQLSPLALLSTLTPKVRSFVAIVSISGAHPNLMPDLSAAVDVAVNEGTH